MGEHQQILQAYREADFNHRLHMWLDHRDIRHEYEIMEEAEQRARDRSEPTRVGFLATAWGKASRLLGHYS